MRLLARARSWLSATVLRSRAEAEMDAEIQFHVERRAEDLVRAGVSPGEALRRARVEFGGVEGVKDACRDVRGAGFVDSLAQDVGYGLRALRKSPGFTATAVAMLGLGIGANTYVFSLVDALVLRPLALRDPSSLVALWERVPSAGVERNEPSPANFLDWKAQCHAFDHMAAMSFWDVNLGGIERPEHIQGFQVTDDYFATVDAQPILGRTFLPQEATAGNDRVAVLSHALWHNQLGGDPAILGKPILLNGVSYTVVGVMAPGFNYPVGARVWAPLAFSPDLARNRQAYFLHVVAHLRPGATVERAQHELSLVAARIARENPRTNAGRDVRVEPLLSSETTRSRAPMTVLLVAVGFVLLIACANLSHLLLARADLRKREASIRAALGATRRRLVRQFLVESLLLALIGGGLGVGMALLCLRFPLLGIPADFVAFVPGLDRLGINVPVLAFTLAVSVLTGLAFGLVPAIRASRADVNEALKEGTRGSGGSRVRGALRSTLIVGEVSLSLMLLVGAGLLMQSFTKLLQVSPGFEPHGVLSLFLALPEAKYPTQERAAAFYQRLVERVAALPGVENAATVNILPMTGMNNTRLLRIEGRSEPAPGHEPEANYRVVSPGYFSTLGIPVVRGRALGPRDSSSSPLVAAVNEEFAKTFFPGEEPLGRRIRGSGPPESNPWFEVVGVIGDVRNDLQRAPRPEMYVSMAQRAERAMVLAVRTRGTPASVAPSVRAAVQALDPDQPVFNVMTLDEWLSISAIAQRLAGTLMAAFAALALVLAAVGLYGVIAYAVAERTREISIRMALGANPRQILRRVAGEGGKLALVGIGLGVLAALGLARAMSGLLFGVGAADATTFGAVALLLLVVTLAACYLPARRASRVSPAVALRDE
jgi:putative ABC transport system permease protein